MCVLTVVLPLPRAPMINIEFPSPAVTVCSSRFRTCASSSSTPTSLTRSRPISLGSKCFFSAFIAAWSNFFAGALPFCFFFFSGVFLGSSSIANGSSIPSSSTVFFAGVGIERRRAAFSFSRSFCAVAGAGATTIRPSPPTTSSPGSTSSSASTSTSSSTAISSSSPSASVSCTLPYPPLAARTAALGVPSSSPGSASARGASFFRARGGFERGLIVVAGVVGRSTALAATLIGEERVVCGERVSGSSSDSPTDVRRDL